QYAASLENYSEHPIAVGIVKSAEQEDISLKEVTDFQSMTGEGIEGNIEGQHINVVSPGYLKQANLTYDKKHFEDLAQMGKTVVFVLVDGEVAGMIGLADVIRESAKAAISELK